MKSFNPMQPHNPRELYRNEPHRRKRSLIQESGRTEPVITIQTVVTMSLHDDVERICAEQQVSKSAFTRELLRVVVARWKASKGIAS